jgi:hypothetical protein
MDRRTLVREIEARKLQHAHFSSNDSSSPLLTVVEGGSSVDWVLCISVHHDRVAAVRIGTQDSIFESPRGAPPDLIWGEEDPQSPWVRYRKK